MIEKIKETFGKIKGLVDTETLYVSFALIILVVVVIASFSSTIGLLALVLGVVLIIFGILYSCIPK